MAETDVTVTLTFVSRDGRSRTAAVLVALLNDLGIRPRLVTFSTAADARVLDELADRSLEMVVARAARPRWSRGDALDALALPLVATEGGLLSGTIIACDTSVHGYPADARMAKIVCFPKELVPTIEERYESPPYRAYGRLCRLLYRRAAGPHSYEGLFLANSEFTREAIARAYPVAAEEIGVIYAPAPDLACKRQAGPAARERSVAVIGGFHPDKRQLDAIRFARAMPETQFALIGSPRSPRYLQRCRQEAEGLANVTLIVDAGDRAIGEILARSRVFLHLKRNEHFGLATVEAVLAGCVPVVHDSGGQREVVPLPSLRFGDERSLGSTLAAALSGCADAELPSLQALASTHTTSRFRVRLRPFLEPLLHGGSR
jgi:glycosyltransferase involved in cell wall biosynthesis